MYWAVIGSVPFLGEELACAINGAGNATGIWVDCPNLPPGARYGEACEFSGSVEGGDDGCTAYYDEDLSSSYCPFETASACSMRFHFDPPAGEPCHTGMMSADRLASMRRRLTCVAYRDR